MSNLPTPNPPIEPEKYVTFKWFLVIVGGICAAGAGVLWYAF